MVARWGMFAFLKPNQAQQIPPDLLKLVPDWYPAGSGGRPRQPEERRI
jgi:hypothetical protein